MEQKLGSGTYLGVEGNWLNSEANPLVGFVDVELNPVTMNLDFLPSGIRQELNYEEKNLIVTVNQLLGDCWSLGARYQFSKAELEIRYPASGNHGKNDSTLDQLTLFALFNHPCGFFARAEGSWYLQSNDGYDSAEPGDDFWQVNLFGGYRFWHRHAQIRLGVLNLADQDYRLNPLNLYTELPRQRTFTVNFQFTF